MSFLDRFNNMPIRHGLPPVTKFNDADLQVTRSGQLSVDYPEGQSLLHLISSYFAEAPHRNGKTLAELYRSELDPDIASWTVSRYAGFSSTGELRWEAVGTSTAGSVQIDRYVLHHSAFLEMPLLHIHNQGSHPKGAILWVSLDGKVSQRDWPRIAALLREGYELLSFDFRGLGETRMDYRIADSDNSTLTRDNFDEAYVNPLGSVLADYVYNSLLTGRPYFLQILDDLKIAELFVRSRNSTKAQEPLTLAASGQAYTLAVRFREIDPRVKIMAPESATILNWSELVAQGREQWPIAFLLPSGASIPEPSK
jgi:hypothetical protein